MTDTDYRTQVELLTRELEQTKQQLANFHCFKCGDGNTPLYCLNCANDALQQQLDAAFKGIICIRCVKHFQVPPYNHNEAAGGECPTCEIERIMASEIQEQSRLINERDEARRAVTSLVCELATAIAERDAAQKAAAEMREFLTVIRQQVFPGLDLPAKYTVWMHDALSTTVGTSYFNLCPKCNYSEKGK